MTKNSTTAARPAADTDDEKEVLFGGVTKEQRLDMTDEELAGMDGADEGDEENADADIGAEADEAEEGDAEDETGDEGEAGEEGEAEEGDDADDEGEEAGEGEDGDEGADAGGEEAEAEEEVAAADDEEDPLDVTRSIMPNEWQLPKDADETLKALNTLADELAGTFDGGDLTASEYRKQSREIDDQIGTLRMQINDAKKSWGKAMNDWSGKTVRSFLRENKEYGAEVSPTLNRMLDAEVRALQLNTNDPFNPRILRTAHANIQKAMGKTPAAKSKDGKRPDAQPPVVKKAKTPVVAGKKPQIPPTLARVPQDEIEDANGGKFARLERLSARDPHAYEESLMKMSAKDRDEYLAGA